MIFIQKYRSLNPEGIAQMGEVRKEWMKELIIEKMGKG